MVLHIEIPVLELFLKISDFEIRGFSIPPIDHKLGGFPAKVFEPLSFKSTFQVLYKHIIFWNLDFPFH